MRHDRLIPHIRTADHTHCQVCGQEWPCENMRAAGAKRAGERNGRAKLTPEQVIAIRSMYGMGALSMNAISRILGLDLKTVKDAIDRKNWKSLP